MSDSSNRPSPGPQNLVIRAVFVPDGAEPPPEFSSDFSPLRIAATRDPATGQITCDNAGVSFDRDVLAQWYPEQEGDDEGAPEPETSGEEENTTNDTSDG